MTSPDVDAAPSAQLQQLNIADQEDTSRPSSAQPQSLAKNAAKNEAKKAAKLAKFEAKQAKKQQSTTAATPNGEEGPKKAKAKKGGDAKSVPIPVTPEGEKKDPSGPMAAAYEPAAVEAGWYSWWEKQGYFEPALRADGQIKPKGKFVMAIPPPNVTGSLHLGHALTDSIQDCLTRWHRMQGYTTLWNPGCDHAGIATQAVVEKKLYRESKTTRHDLGREAFIKQVWVWKEKYGDRIYSQIKRLGASTDWKKVAFTLDPKLSKAVNEAFVRLHEEGIIYRANRLVNWSCKLSTALSNLEVNTLTLAGRTMMAVPGHEPTRKYEFGVIISFAYPIENSEERIIVATTRLETMLADTAICVHPEDERYRHLHHKYCVHPFNGRRIQIIPDEMVDREFGTGAVKITPAHDPNDFAVGKKHGLAFINLLDDNGRINENGGEFQGLMRFDARFKIQEALKAKGLYIETKDNPMALKVCSRSGDIIEPLIKPQWWVNCDDMSAAACDAVRSGALNIQPETSEKEWFKWLENPQDWCISRQLWWGHQIPAYFVAIKGQPKKLDDDKTAWVSGRTEEEAMQKALSMHPGVKKEDIVLERDPDVLDTWFSSALWPFSIFGWPEKTKDFDLFYPNTMLETGWDILFFWVARMVMMGIKLTGQVPFKNVFCHAMVRDAHGRKMSKSLGNVIDPIDVIEGKSLDALMATLMEGNLDAKEVNKAKAGMKEDYPRGIPECGTDAMRFTLCSYTTGGRDINLNILRVDGYRKFCNKLWNATKFAMMKLDADFKPNTGRVSANVNLVDQWILYQLDKTLRDVQSSLTEYNFAQATMHVHQWWLYQLCDVYIEAIKPICDAGLAEGADEKAKSAARAAQQTLYTCLDEGLKMMHPFMPFVTEELWQRLPRRAGDATPSIMVAEWPEGLAEREQYKSEAARFEKVVDVIKGTRSLATLCDLKLGGETLVVAKDAELASLLKAQLPLISTMTGKQSTVQIIAAAEDTAAILGDGQAWQQSAILEEEVTLYIKGALKPQ